MCSFLLQGSRAGYHSAAIRSLSQWCLRAFTRACRNDISHFYCYRNRSAYLDWFRVSSSPTFQFFISRFVFSLLFFSRVGRDRDRLSVISDASSSSAQNYQRKTHAINNWGGETTNSSSILQDSHCIRVYFFANVYLHDTYITVAGIV